MIRVHLDADADDGDDDDDGIEQLLDHLEAIISCRSYRPRRLSWFD